MTDHPHPLISAPIGGGALNYCRDCRDRICLGCDRADHESGGGSWSSGYCLSCQWTARSEMQRRLADAWDEGARAATMDDGIGKATNPYRKGSL